MMTTTHRLIGATVRATNRTHGLAPARPMGEPETVVEVDDYNSSVKTAEGGFYFNGDYAVMRLAKEA